MTSRADMLRREISFSETIESVKLGLRYFLGVTSARDRAYVAFAYLTGAVLPATLALLNRYVIDIASRLSTPADDTLLFKAIWIVLGYFLGLTFLDFFQLHSNPFFRRAFLAATDKVGEDIVRKCCTIRLERFQDTRFYEHVEFLSGRVGDEMMQMMWRIMNVVMGVLSSVGVLALIAGTAPVICLVMVAGVIPCLLLYRKQSNIQYEQAYWELPSYRLVSNAIGMFIRKYYVNEMRFNGLGNIIYNKWKDAMKEVLRERQTLNFSLSFYNMLALLFMNLSVTISLGIVAWNIFTGVASVGVFAMMASAIHSFNESLRSISRDLIYIGYGAKYVKDFNDLMNQESEVMLGEHEPVPDSVEIEFKDVHFRYPGSDRDAIDGVSVKITAGEKVAIIGENGSGKSTFAALLTGLFAPQKGVVMFNGQDIMSCLGTARKSVSCVFQEYGKFELPVKEFIRIGDLYRDVDDEEIQEVACAAGADGFIKKLPNGYATDLGTLGEIGIDISGGEWQRLLLARALIRKGARVMVLDEPTAALDPKAEARLYSEFSELTGDRTTILISHRLSITRIVDRILVFDKGRIVEDGNHDELMRRNGLYAKMYKVQAQWYA